MQRSTEAQGQAGKTPKPRWRNGALTLAPPRAVTGEPLAGGPGMTPITVSQQERLLSITLQTEGRYWLQGSETCYRMPKRSIWGLYKIYYWIIRGGTKSRERDGSRWFGRNKFGKMEELRGKWGWSHVNGAGPYTCLAPDQPSLSHLLIKPYF